VPRPILQSPFVDVICWLDYCNAILAAIASISSSGPVGNECSFWAGDEIVKVQPCNDVMLLLRQLHQLKASEWIKFKLAVFVYKCLHGIAASYLADELYQPAHLKGNSTLKNIWLKMKIYV